MVTLLAPFWGGGRDPWVLGLLLFLAGFCILIWPAPHRLPRRWWVLGAVFLGWCSISLWPCGEFMMPPWRRTLVETYGCKFSIFQSAQPWLSLDTLIFWAAGLLWFFYLGSLSMGRRRRRLLSRCFYYGVLVLAVFAFVVKWGRIPVPFWNSPDGFGPFENRNQFAALLAMTGVLGMALMFDDFRQKQRRAWFLAAGQFVIFNALIWNYSRAGLVLFFGGTALWVFLAYNFSLRRARSWVAMSCLLLAFSSFMLFGGKTVQRFKTAPSTGSAVQTDGRWLVQRDAWSMIMAQPLTGVGLGNFEGVFPFYRKQVKSQDFVRHPESDWLWLAAEAGVPAVLLLWGLIVLVTRGCWPLKPGTDRALRAAGLVSLLMVAGQGLVDVSGHRAGSLWPALMLGALALSPDIKMGAGLRQTRITSLAALILILSGLAWFLTGAGLVVVPGLSRVVLLERQVRQDWDSGKWNEAKMLADEGVAVAPLHWFFYYARAEAHLQTGDGVEAAVEDFRRARALEQSSPRIPYDEGRMLLPYDMQLAVAAWAETLQRAGKDAEQWYLSTLNDMGENPELRQQLAQVARQNPALSGYYWLEAPPEQAREFLDQLLKPGGAVLTEPAKQPDWIWKLWLKLRGVDDMEPFLRAHPEIGRRLWLEVADAYIRTGELEKGYQVLKKGLGTPDLPQKTGDEKSRQKAERDLLRNAGDVVARAGLARAALDAGRMKEVQFYLEPVKDQPAIPSYFHYMLAEAYATQGMWGPAVEALRQYQARVARSGP